MEHSEEKEELLTLQQRLESKIQVGRIILALRCVQFNFDDVLTE